MRAIAAALAALILAACASTPPANTTTFYDHKYNTYSSTVTSSADSVDTGATTATKAQPPWSAFGHP